MDWWEWALVAGLISAQALYDSLYRLPLMRQKIHDLTEERDQYRRDLAELEKRFDRNETELYEALEKLDRIKDPEFYSVLDAGDGQALYDLDRKRGLI